MRFLNSVLKFIFIVIIYLPLNIFAQGYDQSSSQQISCGYDQFQNSLSKDYLKSNLAYEKAYRNYIKNLNNSNLEKSSNVVHRVPIVVHIIHGGAPLGTDQNPTDAMIFSDIQEASDRFRHQHATAGTYTNPNYGVDTEIELCMAKLDPNGNYTSGVIRHYDPINTIQPTYAYMSSLMWDPNLYKNIFIAEDIGGPCGVSNSVYTWYLASCFNPGLINHEIGHHFTLGHTFNGACTNNDCLNDGDKVCDTPPKASPGTGGNSCATPGNSCTTDEDDTSTNNPYRSIANGGMGDQPDMIANYMDYTGGCWDSFTQGQKDRMKFNITNSRMALVNNSGVCDGNPLAANDIGVYGISPNQSSDCVNPIIPSATIYNYGNNTINSFQVKFYLDNVLVHMQTENVTIAQGGYTTINASSSIILPFGNQTLSVSAELPNGNTDPNLNNNTDYNYVNYVGGSSCSNCNEVQSFLCPTSSLTVPENDPSLNLSINDNYGQKIGQFGLPVAFANGSTTPLIAHTDNTFTGCKYFWDNNAVVEKFQVSKTGNYNIATPLVGSCCTVVSIFDSPTFDCTSFLGSNGFDPGNGSISWHYQHSVTLDECTDYWAVSYQFNGATNGNLFIGPGTAYTVSPSPSGYSYIYVAFNTGTGIIDYQSQTGDFTALPSGNYRVYGMSYDSTWDPADVLGLTLSQAYALPFCWLLSENYYDLTISGSCPTAYSTANGNPLTGTVLNDSDFETDGIIESNQIIGDISNPGGAPNTSLDVFYDSKISVILKDGFETILGVSFEAFIDGCGNLFKSEDEIEVK